MAPLTKKIEGLCQRAGGYTQLLSGTRHHVKANGEKTPRKIFFECREPDITE